VAVSAADAAVAYRLLDGSTLVDTCQPCGRPDIEVRLWGTFDMVPADSNPLFNRWHLLNLHFTDGSSPPGSALRGEGWFEVGGEVAVVQRGELEVEYTFGGGQRRAVLTSPTGAAQRLWPMWKAEFVETDAAPTSELHLTLAVAPLRELWFNTLNGMTPGQPGWSGGRLGGADVLNDRGRRVLEGRALFIAAGVDDAEAALIGMDAFDLEPNAAGRIVFSPDRDVRSESLGTIQEGDLVAVGETGTIFRRNHQLIEAFGFMPIVPDLGVDAVRLQPSGEIWFSVRVSAFSELLGQMVGPGDILSDTGRVVRSNKELLARFQPTDGGPDRGLDGFYVWPSGEAWFTVETGFQDTVLGAITNGDLLSDQGYVVGRNLDLVRDFQPLEDVANFGLEGVFIVSDVGEPPAKGASLVLGLNGGTPSVSWKGPGRVFQVEATDGIGRPFEAVSPVQPGRSWTDDTRPMSAARLYRLRTW